MAADDDESNDETLETPVCGYCNRAVKKKLSICTNCNKNFHRSCYQDRHTSCNIKPSAHNLEPSEHNQEIASPPHGLDALQVRESNEEIEDQPQDSVTIIKVLKELLNAKNRIIEEQAEVIKCKNQIIALMEKHDMNPKNPNVIHMSDGVKATTQPKQTKVVANKSIPANTPIPKAATTTAIQKNDSLRNMEQVQQNKMSEMINLSNASIANTHPEITTNPNASKWREVVS